MKLRTDRLFKLLLLCCLMSIGLHKAGLPPMVVIVLLGMLGFVVHDLIVEKSDDQE